MSLAAGLPLAQFHFGDERRDQVRTFHATVETLRGKRQPCHRHAGDDRLLGGEIVVKVPSADVGLSTYVRDRRALEPLASEASASGFQDLLALLFVLHRVGLSHSRLT